MWNCEMGLVGKIGVNSLLVWSPRYWSVDQSIKHDTWLHVWREIRNYLDQTLGTICSTSSNFSFKQGVWSQRLKILNFYCHTVEIQRTSDVCSCTVERHVLLCTTSVRSCCFGCPLLFGTSIPAVFYFALIRSTNQVGRIRFMAVKVKSFLPCFVCHPFDEIRSSCSQRSILKWN